MVANHVRTNVKNVEINHFAPNANLTIFSMSKLVMIDVQEKNMAI